MHTLQKCKLILISIDTVRCSTLRDYNDICCLWFFLWVLILHKLHGVHYGTNRLHETFSNNLTLTYIQTHQENMQ